MEGYADQLPPAASAYNTATGRPDIDLLFVSLRASAVSAAYAGWMAKPVALGSSAGIPRRFTRDYT